MPIHDYLDGQTLSTPEAPYIRDGERRLSYRDTRARSHQIAHALHSAGLGPGDRVAVLAKNSLEYALAYYGCSKAGVVPVPLNYRLAPPEWLYILNDSDAKILFAGGEYVEAVEAMRDNLASDEQIIALNDSPASGAPAFEDWYADHPTDAPAHTPDNADPALQLYTSGTTGHPKGSVLSHRAFQAAFETVGKGFVRNEDCCLVVVPMYHIFGVAVTFCAAVTGGSVEVLSEFTPGGVVEKLSAGEVHFVGLVPAMIQACLAHVPDVAERDYSALNVVAYGASAIAEQTLRQAAEVFRCDFLQLYGMTEIAPFTYLLPEHHERALAEKPALLHSAGVVIPGFEMLVVDEDDQPVAPGTLGEVVAKGPALMTEYWKKPEATAECMRGGWMHTGDAGYLDEEGFLYLQDRMKDMIVSGGENIYPREVEIVLFEHPDIVDAAVIGIPDEQWGETVKAIVVLRDGAPADEERIIDFCRDKLGGYKRPRSVDFLEALPRNPSGKVLKRRLREAYWKGRDRRIAGS